MMLLSIIRPHEGYENKQNHIGNLCYRRLDVLSDELKSMAQEYEGWKEIKAP